MPRYQGMLTSASPQDMLTIQADIQTNYAKAEVFFQTLTVVNIVETPLMDVCLTLKSFTQI